MSHASDPLSVVLFGNSFASAVQIPALSWAGGNRILGIAGRDLAKARATAERFGIEHATDRWQDLLALEPDLVLVSTPVHLHRPMVLATLDALGENGAVLCEKPMALDRNEAREMERAARGRPAFLDHQLRFHPHVRAIHARIGELGTPRHARASLVLPHEALVGRPYSWWFDAARGGGMLGAIGSHLIDLMRFLLGDVRSVRADLDRFVHERRDGSGDARPVTADTLASVTLRFEDGSRADLWCGFGAPGESGLRVRLVGAAGAFDWRDGTELLASLRGAPMEPLAVQPPPTSEEFGMKVDQGVFSRALPLYLRALIDGLRASPRDPIAGAATFADGLAVQHVLDAARCSASRGGGWESVGS